MNLGSCQSKMVIVGSILEKKTFIQDAESWATITLVHAAEHFNTLVHAKYFVVEQVRVHVY